MLRYVLIISFLYCAALVALTFLTRSKNKSSESYLMAGSNLGALLGFFTFAATLFSAFTILGMPDFFRVHGVGAWIFLVVSDTAMVFMVIWVGTHFRKKASAGKYFGMAGFIGNAYGSKYAGIITFFGALIFLVPYIAIQIRGVAIFMNEAFPGSFPMWVWAVGIVAVMLFYSEVGGLKAIIYNDVFQGILLLIAIWVIGFTCIAKFGSVEQMFDKVAVVNEALLTVPGPQGLFSWQFLLGSLIAIVMIPFTQPQVSTRIVIMKDQHALYRMATGIGFFAILVIFPTMLMGVYGAITMPESTTSEFLGEVLIRQQSPLTGSIIMIGLIAAAISTSDSQLFALGGEIRSLLQMEDKKALLITRSCIVGFALIALVFALISGDQLVLLARVSFAGTSIMAPMIFNAIFSKNASKLTWLPVATLIGIFYFIMTHIGLLPTKILGLSSELVILGLLSVSTGIGLLFLNKETAIQNIE